MGYGDKKPKLSDYGLPDNIEEVLEQEKKDIDKKAKKERQRKKKKVGIIGFPAFFLVFFALPCICAILKDKPLDMLYYAEISLGITLGVFGFCFIAYWLYDGDAPVDLYSYRETDNYKKYEEYTKELEAYRSLLEVKKSGYWWRLDEEEFIEAVKKMYKSNRYLVSDGREYSNLIDLVLTDDEEDTAVQCRHHTNPPTVSSVQNFLNAMLVNGFYNGTVVSVAGFDSETRMFAIKEMIELVDVKRLISLTDDDFYGEL